MWVRGVPVVLQPDPSVPSCSLGSPSDSNLEGDRCGEGEDDFTSDMAIIIISTYSTCDLTCTLSIEVRSGQLAVQCLLTSAAFCHRTTSPTDTRSAKSPEK